MASATVGKLNVIIAANSAQLVTGLRQAETALRTFSVQAQSIAGAFGVAGGAFGLVEIGRMAVSSAADLEVLRASFRVLIGDAGKATETFERMRRFADWSPFSTDQVMDAGRALLAVGFGADQVMPALQMLGELSAASKQPINELAMVLGDVRAKGRLMGEELRQFGSRGIPIVDMLSKSMGVAQNEVKGLVEAGKVGFGDVVRALAEATGEGGRFNGMMGEIAGTASGKWEQFKSALVRLGAELGEKVLPMLTQLVDALSWVAQHINAVADNPNVTAMLKLVAGIVPASWALDLGKAKIGGLGGAAGAQASQAEIDALVKSAEAASSVADKLDKETAADMKESSRAAEKLQRDIDKLVESLRTPGEIFIDEISQLREMFNLGLITSQTWERGFAKNKRDLADSLKSARQIRELEGVGAAVKGTSAAFSAVQASNRALAVQQEQKKLEAEQLAIAKKAEEALRKIDANTRRAPVEAKVVQF